MTEDIVNIINRFKLSYRKITPIESGYTVYTNSNIYLIKKEKIDASKLIFINDFKKHLKNNNFPNIDEYIISEEGPYVNYNGDFFVLKKWIDGNVCSTKKPNEIEGATRTLAKLHIASKDYSHDENIQSISNLGKWLEILLARCEDFIYIKCLIEMKSKKIYIDKLFLDNANEIYDMAIEATKSLQDSGYFQWSNLEGIQRYICHHNYNYNNVIIDKYRNYHVINFEHCRYDVRCFDLANFIIATMNKIDWNFDMATKMIESYNDVRNINKIELKIIYSFLQFPCMIWKMANEYYYKEIFLDKNFYKESLIQALNKLPLKIEFLEKFHKRFI